MYRLRPHFSSKFIYNYYLEITPSSYRPPELRLRPHFSSKFIYNYYLEITPSSYRPPKLRLRPHFNRKFVYNYYLEISPSSYRPPKLRLRPHFSSKFIYITITWKLLPQVTDPRTLGLQRNKIYTQSPGNNFLQVHPNFSRFSKRAFSYIIILYMEYANMCVCL